MAIYTSKSKQEKQIEQLIIATKDGDLKKLNELIEQGVDININMPSGLSLLAHAAINGELDTVKCLVEHGADVQVQNNKALICASFHNYTEISKYLINNGADPKAQNNSPLISSIKNKNLDYLKFLIKNGVTIDLLDSEILIETSKNDNLYIAQYLVYEHNLSPHLIIEKAKFFHVNNNTVDWCESYIRIKTLNDKLENNLSHKPKNIKRKKI